MICGWVWEKSEISKERGRGNAKGSNVPHNSETCSGADGMQIINERRMNSSLVMG
jgi:hypothetical protein